MAKKKKSLVEGGEAEKENTPSGIKTEVIYYASKKLQKKLAEQGKYAGEEQSAFITIYNEKLKDMIYIDSKGHATLNLTSKNNICDYEINYTWEYEDRGDEADGWVSKKIYYIKERIYYFDEEITDENVILKTMRMLEEKKKKLEAEMQEKQKIADEEHEKKRKEFIEKKRKEEEEKKRKRREEEAKRKARAEALKKISWINEIVKSINIEEAKQKEKERFLSKFQITDDFIKDEYDISNKPFLRIEAEIDLSPLSIDRKLKLYNYQFEDDESAWEEKEHNGFSDISQMIAEKIAEIFKGEVKEQRSWDYAYLNVITENDTINVASAELHYPDC